MKSVKLGTSYEATLKLDQNFTNVYCSLIFEWGDVIVDEAVATNISTGKYKYTFSALHLNSCGVYKIVWKYISGSNEYTSVDSLIVYTPYLSSLEFFDLNPELEAEFSDKFDNVERKVRNIINTFCGQSFDFKQSKQIMLDGTDTRFLRFPYRLDTLHSISVKSETSDQTFILENILEFVEKDPESPFYLRKKAQGGKFLSQDLFIVSADWGWRYVPQNISDAAELLVKDIFNDDSSFRQHLIDDVEMDTHRLKINSMAFSSTGNLDADILIMDYCVWTMELI